MEVQTLYLEAIKFATTKHIEKEQKVPGTDLPYDLQIGMGWITNAKKALYNKIYNKTSKGCLVNLDFLFSVSMVLLVIDSKIFI